MNINNPGVGDTPMETALGGLRQENKPKAQGHPGLLRKKNSNIFLMYPRYLNYVNHPKIIHTPECDFLWRQDL